MCAIWVCKETNMEMCRVGSVLQISPIRMMERSIHSAKHIFVENLYRRYGMWPSALLSWIHYVKYVSNQMIIPLVMCIWGACEICQFCAQCSVFGMGCAAHPCRTLENLFQQCSWVFSTQYYLDTVYWSSWLSSEYPNRAWIKHMLDR